MCGRALTRVLLGLFFFDVGVSGCSLEVAPSTVVVRFGDPVSVNCTVSGDHDGTGWEASQGSVEMISDVMLVTWRVESLTEWDIRPQCFALFANVGGPHLQCYKKLNITVYKPPDSVSISAVDHTGPMLEGKQYQLQCEVQNIAPVQYLTVKWYKGETLVNQTFYNNLTKTPVNVSSALLITPTSADDGAQYSCVAELELGSEGPQPPPSDKSDPLYITVHYKPRITGCLEHVKLREGVTLANLSSCRAEGNPSPVVTWYKDRSVFNIFTALTRRDVGLYSITAENTLGSVSANFTVGYGPIFACGDRYEVIENESYSIACSAGGFPRLKFTWFKVNWLMESKKVVLPAPMTRGDAGRYKLEASNAFGTASHSLDIDVLYPPDMLTLESAEVDFGASVELRCHSQGNPRPTYTWTYPYTPNIRVVDVDGVSLLKIPSVSEENNGSYSCSARNRIGQVRRTVRLTVRGTGKPLNTTTTVSECPVVKIEPSTVVVRFGDSVSVNCTVPGHDEIGWEASQGSVDKRTGAEVLPWSVVSLTEWDIRPKCFANFYNVGRPFSQCDERLNITVYQPPDSVSISAVNHTGPMLEGKQYQLQCEVQNIAPVQHLTVKWYKGETLVNQTFYDDLTKTPVNVSSTLLITPTSADDGAQYSCVAELELGPEGPQPPPSDKSDPLYITVHYAPTFYSPNNEILEVTEEEVVPLNCSAQGNPAPRYSWTRLLNDEEKEKLPETTGNYISEPLPPGEHTFTCTASNSQGKKIKTFTVKVITIVDYLPLIAGIVALMVVIGIIVFAFIYSIYYKNTKMGQYDLKLGKSRTQNAHVAQNGRDSSLPMKKLTQPSLNV